MRRGIQEKKERNVATSSARKMKRTEKKILKTKNKIFIPISQASPSALKEKIKPGKWMDFVAMLRKASVI